MKKISSILAGLVLGITPILGISKVAVAGCNFKYEFGLTL